MYPPWLSPWGKFLKLASEYRWISKTPRSNDGILMWLGVFLINFKICQCHIQMYFGTFWMVWAPTKVLVTFFSYIFHVKSKWDYSLRILKNKNRNIFGLSATTIGGFWVSLNYPISILSLKYAQNLSAVPHCYIDLFLHNARFVFMSLMYNYNTQLYEKI